jgi:hypothetical protein
MEDVFAPATPSMPELVPVASGASTGAGRVEHAQLLE